MRLESIRRYPVKAMGGEPLPTVDVTERGLTGDRWYAVHESDGRFATGKDSRRFRRRDAVFDYAAHTEAEGVVVAGPSGSWRVGEPALDVDLTERLGAPVTVMPEGAERHHDAGAAGALSLIGTASLSWCEQRWGIEADPRRLRANLVIETDEPFVEESWLGREVRIGEVAVRVHSRVQRCRMIDLPQDGAAARGAWLTRLGQERELSLAVYADVLASGTVAVGDPVTVPSD